MAAALAGRGNTVGRPGPREAFIMVRRLAGVSLPSRRPPLFRICAWCGRFMGVTPPLDHAEITHGICADCAERLHREETRGRHPKYIQAQLGHASIQVTMDVYGQLFPGTFARLVDVLDGVTVHDPGVTETRASVTIS